ncbi:hypothetical protein FF36_05514 [Frankia torreyi]|uniref:Uncharacterized protein n=1 Tax=Frankia torreyi TaxID=1856 RepID=A0A0D8B7B1_9ACTN|nr:hypothetical protein FF36_05514 [Frankia torreyi]
MTSLRNQADQEGVGRNREDSCLSNRFETVDERVSCLGRIGQVDRDLRVLYPSRGTGVLA